MVETTVPEKKSYLMRKDEERCYLRYLFEVDSTEGITRVELIPTIGNEHLVYERADNERRLKTFNKIYIIEPLPEFQGSEEEKERKLFEYSRSEENKERSHWKESKPTLVDRLEVSDPIVRDAFNVGVTASRLFMHYRLVSDRDIRS